MAIGMTGLVPRGFAFGGANDSFTQPIKQPYNQMPFYVRQDARNMMHGPVGSSVPGRVDNIAANVPSGAHVIPADVTSGLGHGNTMAGHAVLDRMFSTGPYGIGLQRQHTSMMRPPAPPRPMGIGSTPKPPQFAAGGGVGDPTPVKLSGGEYVVPPEKVMAIGHGDLQLGHRLLDDFIVRTRKKTIAEMKALPGPAGKG